jgi:hypothetical protein
MGDMDVETMPKSMEWNLSLCEDLLGAMKDKHLPLCSQLTAMQHLFQRNTLLISYVDSIVVTDTPTEEDVKKKQMYILEIHSNLKEIARLVSEVEHDGGK